MTDADCRACYEAFREKHPTGTATGQYDDDELAFLKAVDRYKRVNHRPYPTFAEVLAIARSLGYRK